MIDQAGPTYFSQMVAAAPDPARSVLESLARGAGPDLASLDPPTRRYLRRRGLLTESGALGIPILGDYLRREV